MNQYRITLKQYPDVLTIEEMCEILSVSTKTGYRLITQKKIAALKVGRAYRIPKPNLIEYLKTYSSADTRV